MGFVIVQRAGAVQRALFRGQAQQEVRGDPKVPRGNGHDRRLGRCALLPAGRRAAADVQHIFRHHGDRRAGFLAQLFQSGVEHGRASSL